MHSRVFVARSSALRASTVVLGLVAAASLVLPSASADPTPGSVPDLGGSSSYATAINGSGQVAGASDLEGDEASDAFLWTPGDAEAVDLGALGDFGSSATDVNDHGQVVGVSVLGGGEEAFSWTADGGMQELGGDERVDTVAVNNSGQVLVAASNQGGAADSFIWKSGRPLTQITGLMRNVTAHAMNEQGVVVGSSTDLDEGHTDSELVHAFVWSPGNPVDIGALGTESDNNSEAIALNDAGQVVGDSDIDGSSFQHAFLWTETDGMRDLGDLGGGYSRAIAVNTSGVVAGNSILANGEQRAFVWIDGQGMRSLGSLGGGSSEASALGEDGTVVGNSLTADGETHAFSWTPATGMVDLGSPGSRSAAYDVNDHGVAVGSSSGRATSWDTTDTDALVEAPGAPRGVVAAAGDGSVNVAWAPPSSNGHTDITSYTVTASPGGATRTVSPAPFGGANSVTFDGLSNGTAYSFVVKATNDADLTGPASIASSPVSPQSGASQPVVASGIATTSGGRLSTGDGAGPTPEHPVTASVSVPPGTSGGALNIAQGVRDNDPPVGFTFLGQQVVITAPAASAAHPLILTFEVDKSLAAGLTADSLQLFRTEGSGTPTQVPDCASDSVTASPDPCVLHRYDFGDNAVQLEVLTSSASDWNFATKVAAPPQTYPFRGFLAPYSNPPKINVVKAGASLPLKFSLKGNRGLDVIAPGFPQSAKVSCSRPTNVLGAAARTAGNLGYAKKTDVYTYSWKSAKAYGGTCRAVQLKLKDGSRHNALFRFTK
jgi:probable HAF family extracellular repeat protein